MNIKNKKYVLLITSFLVTLFSYSLKEQEISTDLIKAKGQVVNENTIKLRWAPANARIWLEGKKYGYRLEKYTLLIDSIYQEHPIKTVITESLKPAPLNDWEEQALKSDYTAVIAQAFYGDEFELTSSSSDAGSIINQANELQQRFTTSVFMAEYDYKGAELAGWAYTDNDTKKNEQYLYRIILNRPKAQKGDTTAVFIGYVDKRELSKPIGLNAVWGDQSVMLSWNYELLSPTYHSYHIERISSKQQMFERITDLPVTALSEDMKSIFYTDSLENNDIEYSYRIIGITSFDEEGLPSDTIKGKGKKTINCIPNISNGYFVAEDKAHIFWETDCENMRQVEKFIIKRSISPEGEYETIKDNIAVDIKDIDFNLKDDTNYIRLVAVNKDSSEVSSLSYALHKIDSIPPKTPTGLRVDIDSIGVAFLRWDPNDEVDLRGYRILRSFTEDGEKSSITTDFSTDTYLFDTLSMNLGNEKVYYSITALDIRYNESDPSPTVIAIKPNNTSLDLPRIIDYKLLDDGKILLSWYTNSLTHGITYSLIRFSDKEEIVYEGDENTNTFTDQVPSSGEYTYWVVAKSDNGKQAISPQKVVIFINKVSENESVSNFNAYLNDREGYIELSWKKSPQAASYKIYKKEEGRPITLWKELQYSLDRVVDEAISPNTTYSYTIVFITDSGTMSQAKTIKVNY